MCFHLALSVFLACFLAVPTTAYPAESNSRQAKERAAKKACAVGDTMTGIDLLAELYVETNEPNYIHNQGRCYQQNDDPAHAILRFQEYLRQVPDIKAKDKALIEGYIAECEVRLAQKSPVPTSVVPEAKAEPTPVYPPIALPKLDVPATTPHPVSSSGQGLRIAGVITGIVGIASLGTGLAFELAERSLAKRIRENPSKDTKNNNTIRDDYGTAAGIFGYSGGALVVAGVVFYAIGYAMEPARKVALIPVIGSKYAGLWFQGTL